jgi:hypothetical protein
MQTIRTKIIIITLFFCCVLNNGCLIDTSKIIIRNSQDQTEIVLKKMRVNKTYNILINENLTIPTLVADFNSFDNLIFVNGNFYDYYSKKIKKLKIAIGSNEYFDTHITKFCLKNDLYEIINLNEHSILIFNFAEWKRKYKNWQGPVFSFGNNYIDYSNGKASCSSETLLISDKIYWANNNIVDFFQYIENAQIGQK